MSETHEQRYQRALKMGKPKEHVLKTLPTAWDAIEAGEKMFEVRRNDRFFQRGDTVVLLRMWEGGGCSSRELRRRIGWMLQGGQFGIEPGYCVFSLEDADK